MNLSRRGFIGVMAGAFSLVTGKTKTVRAWESSAPVDPYGCLVDLSRCTGCRKCEQACYTINQFPPPELPFDDLRVLDKKRWPDDKKFTVINRYFPGKIDDHDRLLPVFVKIQCMHCQDPACSSACIVGALTKEKNGAVRYDADKCIGCRYCMAACPFQIPAYEYYEPITPRVRKCTFCFEEISKTAGKPACAAICPVEAITFGKRKTLLKVAKKRIKENPSKYINHIYGEHEVGGTCWMYITGASFEKLDFQKLPDKPIPRLSETIQHSLFKYLWAPITLFGVFGAIMSWCNKIKPQKEEGR